MSQEYINNKNSAFNYFKRKIIQQNFQDIEPDLDDPQVSHNLKSLFSASFALEISPKVKIAEMKET